MGNPLGWLMDKMRGWLHIQPAVTQQPIRVMEGTSRQTAMALYNIWYNGDPSELEQAYTQLRYSNTRDTMFWASVCEGQKIRKIHSGLPAVIVNSLAYVVKSDLADPVFDNEIDRIEWDAIAEDNDFRRLVGKALTETLVNGDGAFKISVDTDVSEYPILDFVPGSNVEYITSRGRIIGIDFYSIQKDKEKKNEYNLIEHYRENSVTYELRDKDGNEVPLETVPELSAYKPIRFTGNYIMAVPVVFFDHPRYTGRGKSIFEGKTGVFDAHDEVISQWMDALRAGRVVKYIPDVLIPRDPNTTLAMPPSDFGSYYVQIASSMSEGARSQIDVVQPDIRYDAFLATYTATLNMCLQGIVSPATLGIDVGKMSSAEAQREKKDVTGNTRNAITEALQAVIPSLITAALKTYDNIRGGGVREPKVTVSFGEYGAPDFDSRVATIAAATPVMSVEAQVDELWGNSKDDRWKETEVQRIMRDRGVTNEIEPGIGAGIG